MLPTEQDLRDLLAERSAAAPDAPDRLTQVHRRVRSRSRRELAIAVLTVGVIVVAGGSIMRHATVSGSSQQPVAPPSTTTPLPSSASNGGLPPLPYPYAERGQTHTAIVDGLRITTDGPHQVAGTGRYPFTVLVTLTNTSRSTWHGSVGVGLYGSTGDNYFGQGQFLYAADSYTYGCCSSSKYWFTRTMTTAFSIQGIADPTQRVISPGQTITFQIAIVKPAYGIPHAAIRGWIPVLDPMDLSASSPSAKSRYPNPNGYPTVDWG